MAYNEQQPRASDGKWSGGLMDSLEHQLMKKNGGTRVAAHQLAVEKVAACVRSLHWEVVETIPSPITGAEGNREFLLYAKRI